MSATFTYFSKHQVPEQISLRKAYSLPFNEKTYLFFPQVDSEEVPVVLYDSSCTDWDEKFKQLNITNQQILRDDARANSGEMSESRTEVEGMYGLQLKKKFGNGTSMRYKLNLETMEWQRLPPPQNPEVYAQLMASCSKHRLVLQSPTQLALEVWSGERLVKSTEIPNSNPIHNRIKMLNVAGKVYIVMINTTNKTREVIKVESDGNLNWLTIDRYLMVKRKVDHWVHEGAIFQFTYRRNMKLEYFDFESNTWLMVNLRCTGFLKDVLSVHHHNKKIEIVFRNLRNNDLARANSVGVAILDLMPDLQTTVLLQISRECLSNEERLGEVMRNLTVDSLLQFIKLHCSKRTEQIARLIDMWQRVRRRYDHMIDLEMMP